MKKQKKLTSHDVSVDNFSKFGYIFHSEFLVNNRLKCQFHKFLNQRDVECKLVYGKSTLYFSGIYLKFCEDGYVRFWTDWGKYSFLSPASTIEQVLRKLIERKILMPKYVHMLLSYDVNNPPAANLSKNDMKRLGIKTVQDKIDRIDYGDWITRKEHNRVRNIQGLNPYYNAWREEERITKDHRDLFMIA